MSAVTSQENLHTQPLASTNTNYNSPILVLKVLSVTWHQFFCVLINT